MKKFAIIAALFFTALSLSSCTKQESYDVYTTVYPMQYIAEQIFAGTPYTVGIVPGVTSHENSIDWSPKEIIAMTEATYLFYVGANYDQYIDFQINSIFVNKDVELVKIEDQTDYIQFIEGVIHVHEGETINSTALGLDPHFWISPYRMISVAHLIYDKLILKFDDTNHVMESNFQTLVTNLQNLSDSFANVLANANKVALTSTNIYGYLREDYGFNYLSISPGYHEEAEQFTSQEKEEIVNHAVENNIRYIIYELYTSSPLSNAVYDELVTLNMDPIKLEFNILQALPEEDQAAGSDYISVMYDNLELLKLAVDYHAE